MNAFKCFQADHLIFFFSVLDESQNVTNKQKTNQYETKTSFIQELVQMLKKEMTEICSCYYKKYEKETMIIHFIKFCLVLLTVTL